MKGWQFQSWILFRRWSARDIIYCAGLNLGFTERLISFAPHALIQICVRYDNINIKKSKYEPNYPTERLQDLAEPSTD